jgi:hypothetical protein
MDVMTYAKEIADPRGMSRSPRNRTRNVLNCREESVLPGHPDRARKGRAVPRLSGHSRLPVPLQKPSQGVDLGIREISYAAQ